MPGCHHSVRKDKPLHVMDFNGLGSRNTPTNILKPYVLKQRLSIPLENDRLLRVHTDIAQRDIPKLTKSDAVVYVENNRRSLDGNVAILNE